METKMSTAPSGKKLYQITVEGKIDTSWSAWFGGMEIISERDADELIITILSGPVNDQAALRGMLNHLWDLNLVLRSIQQICTIGIDVESKE
jgi:hypothetical protein